MSFSERIALIGATGQLGSDIRRLAEQQHLALTPLSHDDLDITDGAAVSRTISGLRPTVVINAGALHQVDRCEEEPDLAFQVNAEGAGHVAAAAHDAGARCVYVSTDYVFAGDKKPPAEWTETDTPLPVNTYGKSKLAGERATLTLDPGNMVVRTASLFGIAGARSKGGNFIETILKKAKQGGPLTVVNDQWMTPTYTDDLAAAILELIGRRASGIVHVTNVGTCTWHALAARAVQLAGLSIEVTPVPASTYPSRARRPANSALGSSRLPELLGRVLRPWPEALKAYLVAKGHIQERDEGRVTRDEG